MSYYNISSELVKIVANMVDPTGSNLVSKETRGVLNKYDNAGDLINGVKDGLSEVGKLFIDIFNIIVELFKVIIVLVSSSITVLIQSYDIFEEIVSIFQFLGELMKKYISIPFIMILLVPAFVSINVLIDYISGAVENI